MVAAAKNQILFKFKIRKNPHDSHSICMKFQTYQNIRRCSCMTFIFSEKYEQLSKQLSNTDGKVVAEQGTVKVKVTPSS